MILQKREKGDSVPDASLMLKLVKRTEEIKKPIGADRVAYLCPMGFFLCLYLNFSLIFGKIILSYRR